MPTARAGAAAQRLQSDTPPPAGLRRPLASARGQPSTSHAVTGDGFWRAYRVRRWSTSSVIETWRLLWFLCGASAEEIRKAVLLTKCRSTTRTADAWARAGLLDAAVVPRADQVRLAESSLLRASCRTPNGPSSPLVRARIRLVSPLPIWRSVRRRRSTSLAPCSPGTRLSRRSTPLCGAAALAPVSAQG